MVQKSRSKNFDFICRSQWTTPMKLYYTERNNFHENFCLLLEVEYRAKSDRCWKMKIKTVFPQTYIILEKLKYIYRGQASKTAVLAERKTIKGNLFGNVFFLRKKSHMKGQLKTNTTQISEKNAILSIVLITLSTLKQGTSYLLIIGHWVI